MKHILLLLIFLGSSITGFTQNNEDVIKRNSINRAEKEVEYIAQQMKSLTPEDIEFLKKAFYTKFFYVSKYAKAKGTTKEYKQAIYKKSAVWISTELNKRFSEEKTLEILTIFRQRREANKKKNN
jgi:hypothetical protein